jgi:hypothetical protein
MTASLRPLPIALILPFLLLGCETAPVEWIDGAARSTGHPSPLAQSPMVPIDSSMRVGDSMAAFLETQELLREAGARSLLTPHLDSMKEAQNPSASTTGMEGMNHATGSSTVGEMGSDVAPMDSSRCVRSLRTASAPGKGTVAVWWSRREGGRVSLLSAWRDSTVNGLGPWQGPVAVDTVDQGPMDARADERNAAGCARAAPHAVIDAQNGFVHVTYALTGPEGAGIFYAHQMVRHVPFEPPAAVIYGERLGVSRIASAGDLVVIAYEDPNGGSRAGIGLAVSRSAGHVFDDRLVVTSSTLGGRDPHVAAKGTAIVVGWSEFSPGDSAEPNFLVRRARLR